MSEFVAPEGARSAPERELDYLQAVKRPEVQGRVTSAERAGGYQIRDYLDAKAEYDALERRVAMLAARRWRSRPAEGGRISVGAAHEAQRSRRRERRRAALDEAVVRSWLRELSGRLPSRRAHGHEAVRPDPSGIDAARPPPRSDAVSTVRQASPPPNERMTRATQSVDSPQTRLSGLDRSP